MCAFCLYCHTFARGKYARLTCFGLVTSLSSTRGGGWSISAGDNPLTKPSPLGITGCTATKSLSGSVELHT